MSKQKKTAEQLIEDGAALVAQGMFRKGSKEGENDPLEAYELGMSVVSIVRSMALDFQRQVNR